MLSGQKGYGSNGKQNFLFPLDEMYMTQGSYTATYSHNGCYAMDFVGWNGSSQVNIYPYYAPFDCTLVARWGSSSPMVVWQSNNEVNFIDGTVGYACIGFVHDDDVTTYPIGSTRSQGDLIGHTGTYGSPGSPHVHIEAKKGTYNGYHQNSQGVWMLTDSTWLYDLIGLNDTTIYRDYYINMNGVRVNYPWDTFSVNNPTPGPVPPVSDTRYHFPWYIKYRKRRNGLL